MYQSLIYPCPSNGFKSSWGQATNNKLDKLLILQKRALRLAHFSPCRKDQAISLFMKSNILPISFLYVESICNLMHKVKNTLAPVNLRNLLKEEYTRIAQGRMPQVISKSNTRSRLDIDKTSLPFQNLEPKRGMQYQHIFISF